MLRNRTDHDTDRFLQLQCACVIKKIYSSLSLNPLGNVMSQLKHLHTYVTWLLLQAHFTAASNERRKLMSASLSSELRQKHSVSGSSAAVQVWFPAAYVVVVWALSALSKLRVSKERGLIAQAMQTVMHQTLDGSSSDKRNLISSSPAKDTRHIIAAPWETHIGSWSGCPFCHTLGVCCVLSSGLLIGVPSVVCCRCALCPSGRTMRSRWCAAHSRCAA